MGDFNYPHIDWDTYDCDKNSEMFVDLVQDCFLTEHVHEPTRSNNILDLILTSESNMVDQVQVKEHLATSYHNILMWKLCCDIKIGESKREKYAYQKADYASMNK